jgi:hypothetical protein
MKAIAALLLLNAAFVFDNLWPTPWIVPDHRISPELVLGWCALLVWLRVAGPPGERGLSIVAAAAAALALGRYADVTVRGLFGRPLNLYWDGLQIPTFLSVSAGGMAMLQAGGAIVALALVVWLLFRGMRVLVRVVAREAAPAALRSPVALVATALLFVSALANYAGVPATWSYVARPVLPTYTRQAAVLRDALQPGRAAISLPASPAFDGNLDGLAGADLTVIFVESYGAVVFDDPAMRAKLDGARAAMARGIADSGRQVVSAFVRSPTFAGGSELAHLGLLSGLDLQDPLRHDQLLTSDRRTLVHYFRSHGYQTFGLYPALSWNWPERVFYGFDVFLDGRDLGYRGPKLGYWSIPDQFTIARFEQLHPLRPDSPPRLLFFPTITSHAPFRQVPPYQPDWERLLTPRPFDEPELGRALAERSDWLNMYEPYARMLDYTGKWLGGWLARPRSRPETVVVLGDHQPAGSVSGPDARWDVPVHVVSADPALLERLRAYGFVPGLVPSAAPVGAMHELTAMLLDVFDGRGLAGR